MWKSTTSDRLEKWKTFRQQIDQLDIEQALAEVANFWSTAPFTPYYLDYDRPEDWPDPWTLIAENYYCDLAKALGILYTLHLSTHKVELTMCIMRNKKDRSQYNLVFIDNGKYVLNLESGEVVNKNSIPEDLVLVVEYNNASMRLDRF